MLCITAVVLLAWPGVAYAKGPESATIEADNLTHPIAISGPEGGGSEFWKLVEQSGFFPALFGQTPDPMLEAAPTDQLGAALVVTWRLPSPADTTDVVRQTLYPDAAGGPLTYTEPGQPFFGSQRSRGGWFHAPAELTVTIERIVVTGSAPAAAPPAAPTVSTTRGEATTATRSDGADHGRAWWPLAVGAAAVMLLATGVAAYGRKRVRMSPV
jgi:hypothetical protein